MGPNLGTDWHQSKIIGSDGASPTKTSQHRWGSIEEIEISFRERSPDRSPFRNRPDRQNGIPLWGDSKRPPSTVKHSVAGAYFRHHHKLLRTASAQPYADKSERTALSKLPSSNQRVRLAIPVPGGFPCDRLGTKAVRCIIDSVFGRCNIPGIVFLRTFRLMPASFSWRKRRTLSGGKICPSLYFARNTKTVEITNEIEGSKTDHRPHGELLSDVATSPHSRSSRT